MKSLFAFFLIVLAISGCTVNDCINPDFYVANSSQGASGFQVNVFASGHGFYEVQYGSNGFSLGSGTTTQVNDQTIVNVANGAYDVYLRGNCGGDDWSDWEGPKSILVAGNTSFCDAPGGAVHFESGPTNHFQWTQNFADFFEVEFGPTGFTLGSGTGEAVNSSSYSTTTPAQGTAYDFYVRANCGGTNWSDWSGPVSFIGS